MPIDVATLSSILSGRCGGMVTAAGLDGAPTSEAWVEPIAASMRIFGFALADPTTVTDADFLEPVAVTQDDLTGLLDVAELRALEMAQQNYTRVTQRASLQQWDWSDIGEQLEKMITRKAAYVEKVYGIGLSPPTQSTLPSNYAAQNTWFYPLP